MEPEPAQEGPAKDISERVPDDQAQRQPFVAPPEIASLNNEQLLNYAYYLDMKNRQMMGRIAALEPFKQREIRKPPANKQQFLFDKFLMRKFALKIAYIGRNYNGMAVQECTDNTIEAYLFKCLYSLSLIPKEAPSSEYRRAGRTDKGVSAFGNVVSLLLRTCEERNPEEGVNQPTKDRRDGCLEYAKMLNAILPEDIRVLAFKQVDDEFDARRHCLERQYKYFFTRGHLNMQAMRQAQPNYLFSIAKFEGRHNFVNFCKLDVTSTLDHEKTIVSASIQSVDTDLLNMNAQHRNELFFFHFVGNSFLWHQIRYMASLLFMIGQGKQSPEIIDDLLDLTKYPNKPNYTPAVEYPLILEDCRYANVKFDVHKADAVSFYNTFNQIVMREVVELTLYVNCMHLMRVWLENSKGITPAQMVREAETTQKVQQERRNKKVKLLKPSGLTVEDCVKGLKGKSKELHEKVASRRNKYTPKAQVEGQATQLPRANDRLQE